MHKNPHQNAGNGIKETLIFKIFLGSMPPTPLEVLAPKSGKFMSTTPKIMLNFVSTCLLSPHEFIKILNFSMSP